MDLSFPVLWNYGVQSRDYYFAIQDKLIYTNVLVTHNGSLVRYSSTVEIWKLLSQRFFNIFT